MLGDLAAGGMLGGADDGDHGRAAHRLDGARRRGRRRCCGSPPARPASSSAPTRCSRSTSQFADLGLVVVDEQHRFGVEQRAALTDKAGTPAARAGDDRDADPAHGRDDGLRRPRDLDAAPSCPPAARRSRPTSCPLAEQPDWIDRAWQRVREEVEKGHQVYVVCPRIRATSASRARPTSVDLDDDGDDGRRRSRPLAAVEDVVAELRRRARSPGCGSAMLHGRLPPDEKDASMRAFAAGEIDVLVATTVIEVGVDVPNATMMVVLDADRFGVSQLHQLRGRVGRGGLPGLCLLVTARRAGTPARERLDAVAATTDGFELAGSTSSSAARATCSAPPSRASGPSLRLLRVLRDEKTIVAAREAAEALLADDPGLAPAPDAGRRGGRAGASPRQSDYMEKA